MIPYNYIDLVTMDKQNSRFLTGQKFHLGPRPEVTLHASSQAQSQWQHHHQIQVNSTIDADIVLRRVIEDRAAILALKRRSTENEVMLMKAKSRQLHISKILERQDQDIARFTAKAKRELTEYNGRSNQYIHSFVLAFDNGDMDGLQHHPFVPPLEELEQSISRRKATLIEKVQSDDRVKKLEFTSTQERVTRKVLKKNEEAFLRAIEMSKQKFSDSCETWIGNVNELLSGMPRHAQEIGAAENGNSTETKRPQRQPPAQAFGYPPEMCYSQDLHYPEAPHQNKGPTTQEMQMKRPPGMPMTMPIVHVSPDAKHTQRAVGNFQPIICSGFPDFSSGLLEESPSNKRQREEKQLISTRRRKDSNKKQIMKHHFFPHRNSSTDSQRDDFGMTSIIRVLPAPKHPRT